MRNRLFVCLLAIGVLVSDNSYARISVSTEGVQNSIKEVQRQSEEENRQYEEERKRTITHSLVSEAKGPLLKWRCKTYCTGCLGFRKSGCMEDIVYARDGTEAERIIEDKYYSYCRENFPFYSNGAGSAMAETDCDREW